MDNKLAIISIFVKKIESVPEVNHLLSLHGNYIIGRIGIPFHEKKVNIISVVINAKQDIINSIIEKIEKIEGVDSKTSYSNI